MWVLFHDYVLTSMLVGLYSHLQYSAETDIQCLLPLEYFTDKEFKYKTGINNYTQSYILDVITRPCPGFDGGWNHQRS